MRMVKPSGEPYLVESAENENCVLAIVFQTVGFLVGEADGQRLLTLDGVDHGLCQFRSTLTALEESLVGGKRCQRQG